MKYILLSILGLFFLSVQHSYALGTGTTSTGVTSNTGVTSTGSKISCLVSSIEKRDTNIRTAHKTYTDTVDAAYPLRTREVSQAYLNVADTDIRDATVKSAWKKWKSTLEGAKKKKRETFKGIWKTYSLDIKACGITTKNTDMSYGSWDSGN